jgi:hypothetical protein
MKFFTFRSLKKFLDDMNLKPGEEANFLRALDKIGNPSAMKLT